MATDFSFNDRLNRVEVEAPAGKTEAAFLVPPTMEDGQQLMPILIRAFRDRGALFHFFGRYDARRDSCEFALAGPPGYRHRVVVRGEEGGWRVERRGRTRGAAGAGLGAADRAVACVAHGLMRCCARPSLLMIKEDEEAASSPSESFSSYRQEILAADAFLGEDTVRVPMQVIRRPEAYKVGLDRLRPRRFLGAGEISSGADKSKSNGGGSSANNLAVEDEDAWSLCRDYYGLHSVCLVRISIAPLRANHGQRRVAANATGRSSSSSSSSERDT